MTPYEKIEEIASEITYCDDVEHLHEALNKIYCIAHVMVGRCGNKHSDWVTKYGLQDNIN